MLPFKQLRNDLVQDENHQDQAVCSLTSSMFTEGYDEDHPVYVTEGVWASHNGAKQLSLRKLQLILAESSATVTYKVIRLQYLSNGTISD